MPDLTPTTGRPRILLVEDDASVRRSLQLLLRSQNYDVRAYGSGQSLSEDPEALKADCLVADLCMPDTNGVTLLKELRAVGWQGPAILISGQLDEAWKALARSGGFANIFEKPLSDNVLVAAVRKLVRQPQTGCAPAA